MLVITLRFGHHSLELILVKRHNSPFEWRHFEPPLIVLCVGWRCRNHNHPYRDIEGMTRERGLDVDRYTVFRRVRRYAPAIDKRIRQHSKMSGTSFRVVVYTLLVRCLIDEESGSCPPQP